MQVQSDRRHLLAFTHWHEFTSTADKACAAIPQIGSNKHRRRTARAIPCTNKGYQCSKPWLPNSASKRPEIAVLAERCNRPKQVLQKDLFRPRLEMAAKHRYAEAARRVFVCNPDETAPTGRLNRHFRNRGNTHPCRDHRQNRRKLSAFKNHIR